MTPYRLPGSLDAHALCGVPVRGVGCPGANGPSFFAGEHARRVVVNRCHRADCPTCFKAWAHRASDRAAGRLWAAKGLYAAARRRGGGQVKHVVLSPPNAESVPQTIEAVKKLRLKMRRILDKHGWNGGLEVFHPWRTTARGKGRYRKGGNYWSPHFHLVGFGFTTASAQIHAETGWVLKNVGPRHSEESVRATVAYLLDHAGVDGKSHVVTWAGSCSYRSVVRDRQEKVDEVVKCDCGQACLEFPASPDGEIDWRSPLGTATERVVVRYYRLRTATAAGQARMPNAAPSTT